MTNDTHVIILLIMRCINKATLSIKITWFICLCEKPLTLKNDNNEESTHKKHMFIRIDKIHFTRTN